MPAGDDLALGARKNALPQILIATMVAVMIVSFFAWSGNLRGNRDLDSLLGALGQGGDGEVTERVLQLRGLAFDLNEPSRLYIATQHGLVTLDDDQNFRHVGEERMDMPAFTAVSSADGEFLLLAGGPVGASVDLPEKAPAPSELGLRISRDKGTSWQVIGAEGGSRFQLLTASQTDPAVIYGWSVDTLFRSDNGGADWSIVPTAGLEDTEHRVFALEVHPDDAERLLAATYTGIAESRDGGQTWNHLVQGSIGMTVTFDPSDSQRIIASVASGQRGYLVESKDGGQTWTPVGGDVFGYDPVAYLAIHPSDPLVIYAGSFQSNLYRSFDGGWTWTQLVRDGRVVRR